MADVEYSSTTLSSIGSILTNQATLSNIFVLLRAGQQCEGFATIFSHLGEMIEQLHLNYIATQRYRLSLQWHR